MNLASLLLCLVFAAVGYIVHPMILSSLVEANVVSASVLSKEYEDDAEVNVSNSDESQIDQAKPSKLLDDDRPRILDEVTQNIEEVDPIELSDQNDPFITEPEIPERVPTPTLPEPVVEPEPIQPNILAKTPALSSVQMLELMKKSVTNRKVKEFAFQDVANWEITGVKEIDGNEYQVGEVTYEQNSIFGNKTLKAKALFQEEELVKWVWPETHAEMK